jgi:hypothetical protein
MFLRTPAVEQHTGQRRCTLAHVTGEGPSMEHASDGIEQIAMAIMEMQQRTEALLAENRRLRAELATLRQGVGIMVSIEGRLYPLIPGVAASIDPPYPTR